MAHVLVGLSDDSICRMFEEILNEEGHTVTVSRSNDDTLAVLRSSLHPLVALLFYQGVTAAFLPDLLELAIEQRDTWAPHAYLICAYWPVAEDPRLAALIQRLGLPAIPMPCTMQQLFGLIEVAAARIGAA